MSRRVKIKTEIGVITLELLREVGVDGEWEPEWEPLRGTVFGDQFSFVEHDTVEGALRGLTLPLVRKLGIQPVGALKKISKQSRECQRKSQCPLYSPKECFPEAKNMPWCFEPEGVELPEVRSKATRAIETWREGVYIVVVQRDPNGSIFR